MVATPESSHTPDQGSENHAAKWCNENATGRVTCLWHGTSLLGILVRPDASTTHKGPVLVDPGGPGLDLPKRTDVAGLVPRAFHDRAVVFPVEPWVSSEDLAQCVAITPPSRLDALCAAPPSTTSRLELLLSAVKQSAGQDVEGALLESFGAARWFGAIQNRTLVDWIVLASPSPPPGTPANDIAQHRADSATKLLTAPCRTPNCTREVIQRTMALATGRESSRLTGREFSLGLLALSTLPNTNQTVLKEISRGLERGKSVSPKQESLLRRLGTAYSGVGANGATQKSTFGLWADLCPAYANWRVVARSANPLVRAQSYIFRGCLTPNSVRTTQESRTADRLPYLLLPSKSDTIVPYKFQMRWRHLAAPDSVRRMEGHAGVDDPRVTRQLLRWIDAVSAERSTER